MENNIIKDSYWVVNNLVLGTRKPTCRKEVDELIEVGIDGIITLLDNEENHDLYKSSGIDFLWVPIKGGTAPTLDQVKKAYDYYSSFKDKSCALAIHCTGGKKRTATLIASILILDGMNYDDAMLAITSANSEIVLSEVQTRFLLSL